NGGAVMAGAAGETGDAQLPEQLQQIAHAHRLRGAYDGDVEGIAQRIAQADAAIVVATVVAIAVHAGVDAFDQRRVVEYVIRLPAELRHGLGVDERLEGGAGLARRGHRVDAVGRAAGRRGPGADG